LSGSQQGDRGSSDTLALDRDTHLPEGTLLAGKYRIVRAIGSGGMGTVYEVEHVHLKKRLAVKLIRREYSRDVELVKRFYREARAASALGSKGIVDVHDIGSDENGLHYMVMDLLEGETLDECLKRSGRLQVHEALTIVAEILHTLHLVHEKGIVHRDMKPQNIFLAREEDGLRRVKILDFGLALERGDDETTKRLTSTGAVLGTPFYLSPEQVRGAADTDRRADVYACGVILYQLLVGDVPFNGETIAMLFVNIVTGEPRPIGSHGVDLPRGLGDVVMRSIARERSDRYQSAMEMLNAIRPYLPPNVGTQPPFISQALPLQTGLSYPQYPMGMSITPSSWARAAGDIDGRMEKRRKAVLLVTSAVIAILLLLAAAGITAMLVLPRVYEKKARGMEVPAAAPAAGTSRASAPGPGKELADFVEVTFTGVPEGTTVLRGGEILGNPARLPRSSEALQVELLAPDYESRMLWVTPLSDLTLEVELSPLEPDGTMTGRRKDPDSSKEAVKKDSKPAAKKKGGLDMDLDYDASKKIK